MHRTPEVTRMETAEQRNDSTEEVGAVSMSPSTSLLCDMHDDLLDAEIWVTSDDGTRWATSDDVFRVLSAFIDTHN
jgi:hypothetical protein